MEKIKEIKESVFQVKEQKGMYDSEEEDIFGGNKNSRLTEILHSRHSVSYGQVKRIDMRTQS